MSRRLAYARIDWSDGAPRSRDFGDIYFSGDGLAETRRVFLDGNDLGRRFAERSRLAVGELGFGTGLNFLATVARWRSVRRESDRLSYFSVDGFPLHPDDLARAHSAWPELADDSSRLRRAMPPPLRGLHRVAFAPDITLTLALGDAAQMLARAEGGVDAWFLDGFAPAKNPALWSPEALGEVARLSRPGATFATYTVAGEVRRRLAEAGFAVEKAPGFGAKKEMLKGSLAEPSAASSRRAPWFQTRPSRRLEAGACVGVVGGGIAGASLADAARRAGLNPVIVEKERLAAGASGNPAGVVMPRLDLGAGPASEFFVAAYLHSIRTLSELSEAFSPCGVLLRATSDEERERHRRIAEADLLPDGWIERRDDGLFFPQAGVVDPPALVEALAQDCEIRIGSAARLRPGDAPEIEFADGRREAFDAVVLANGAEALRFAAARTLPLSAVAGQIDYFPKAPAPDFAHAFGPYAAPAPRGGLVIGATYERRRASSGLEPTAEATRANIAAVAKELPALANALGAADSLPRVSARCQTPDRLPIAGPVPDWNFYGSAYDDLRLGRVRDYPPGEVARGIYALAGLGSRGLVTAPLLAAHLVAEMTGDISPVPFDVAEIAHPARFFIRALKRARSRAETLAPPSALE
jgi:tRNA 5-methylaminomethyl-2-thiouridine biosynthesis bifunctional protein